MSRLSAWVLPVLAGALVISIAVAAAFAAGQPAATPKPQMVRFVTQFITFTPKDASVLGDGGGPSTKYPRLALANLNPKQPYAVRQPDGIWLYKGLEDLAPKLGPFDAFRSRNHRAVEKALARMDDRWNYHVLTLWNSGPVGSSLFAHGTAGPYLVRTAAGRRVGPSDRLEWKVTRSVRVDKLLGGDRALVEKADVLETLSEWGYDTWTMRTVPAELRLGACVPADNRSAAVGPYRTAGGASVPAVVQPGHLFVDVVEVGEWPKGPSGR